MLALSLLSSLDYQALVLSDFHSRTHAFDLPLRASSGVISLHFFKGIFLDKANLIQVENRKGSRGSGGMLPRKT